MKGKIFILILILFNFSVKSQSNKEKVEIEKNIQDSQVLYLEADELIKNYSYDLAFKKLNEALELDSKNSQALNHLGWIYETKFKDYEKAEELYSLSIKYNPKYSAPYYNKLILFSTLRRFDELEKLFTKAVKIPGINLTKVYLEAAIMYELKKDFRKAIEYYKKSINSSLSSKEIDRYIKSIERCKRKIKLEED
ncbi:hypothetical protein [Aureivirga sp. CE67]|uniref:hypothetical protein n=1 Tax=Aureivirga sp. CE67 TaxID=1788983 RepID=UPI0018CB230F|nr:hypothetical protein [Aureivirga sp. CE67]